MISGKKNNLIAEARRRGDAEKSFGEAQNGLSLCPMPYREARIYDRDFPSASRIIAGDPSVKNDQPRRVWKQAMGKDEFAVLFRHFETHRFLMPDGKRPEQQGSALCLVFDNLQEARSYCRELVERSRHTVCSIYSETGVVERIRNWKLPIEMWAAHLLAFLVWGAFFCGIGLSILFVGYELVQFLLGHPLPAIGSYRLWAWVLFCSAGLFCGLAAYLVVLFWKTKIRVKTVHEKLTPEEWNRYSEELSKLKGSSNPEDHARYATLWNEMQRKLRS